MPGGGASTRPTGLPRPRTRTPGPDRPALPGEQVLLDHDALAEGHEFYSVGGVSVSPDATLLAYSTDTVGDERYVLQVKDLTTGELLADRIEGVLGGGVWSPDGRDLYYCTVDDSWRRDKVWRHRLGSTEPDELVFHETDERFWVGIGRSRTQRFLVIATGSKNTTESRYLDCADPDAEWVVFHPREEGLQYRLEHAVDRRRGPLPGPPRPRGRRLRARVVPDRAHAAHGVDAASSPTTSGSVSRTSRRTPGIWSSISAAAA